MTKRPPKRQPVPSPKTLESMAADLLDRLDVVCDGLGWRDYKTVLRILRTGIMERLLGSDQKQAVETPPPLGVQDKGGGF